MKKATSKYWRLYVSIGTIETKISKLNWNQRAKKESLETKLAEKNKRLEKLSFEVTQEEFENHLACNMCCLWEDFISNRNN